MEKITQTKNLLAEVMKYHNEGVVRRISKDTECEYSKAFEIFQDTKRFLFLCGVHGGGLAPSVNIDEGWHSFILFTKDYFDFCLNFFGDFIHHYPNPENFDRAKGLQQVHRTLELAKSEFGELSYNWNYMKKGELVMEGTCSIDAPCSDNPCTSCSPTTNCQSTTSDCSN